MSVNADDRAKHDVEDLAEAMLDTIEEDADRPSEGDAELVPEPVRAAYAAMRRLGIDWVRRYHRLEITTTAEKLEDPVLFVGNHGFGGVFDLNALAISAAFDELALSRPVIALTHQVAWTLGVGKFLEPMGARPAGRDTAAKAFEAGAHVLVLPGGDVEGFKSFADRNKIIFGGRRGFAKLAMEAGVPIVPIVTAGAGESLYVVSDGSRLARALRIDKMLRLKAIPVSVSLPWGFNIGVAGMLPYLPLPSKLVTRVLDPMVPEGGETAEEFGDRVEVAMQHALDELVEERGSFLG